MSQSFIAAKPRPFQTSSASDILSTTAAAVEPTMPTAPKISNPATCATPSTAPIKQVTALTKNPCDSIERQYRRGEVWVVAADPNNPAVGNEIWSNRPAVIVSGNVLNGRSGFAQVVYLSTSNRKRTSPTHVALPSTSGEGEVMALCEQVHSVDQSRLQRKIGEIPHQKIRDIDAALTISLSIGRNPDTYSLFHKWEEHIKLHGIDIAAEIRALEGQTADQRVIALTKALKLVTIERDAFQCLYETLDTKSTVMNDVATAMATL